MDYSRANRSVPKNVDQFIENPNIEEFLWTILQQFDKFLKKFLVTSCFIDQSDCSKIKYKIWLVNETGS